MHDYMWIYEDTLIYVYDTRVSHCISLIMVTNETLYFLSKNGYLM